MMNRKLEIPLQEQKNNMTPNLTKEIYDLAKSALMKKIYEVRAYHLGKENRSLICLSAFSDLISIIKGYNIEFLDAFSHLYKRVCPSVRPSVRRSVGPSVRHTQVEIMVKCHF